MHIPQSTFLVTGGASGLGRAAAEALIAAGARVVLVDVNAETGAATAAALGNAAVFAQADVSDEAQVQAAIALALSAFGRLDGVVNAAGIAPADFTAQRTVAEWRSIPTNPMAHKGRPVRNAASDSITFAAPPPVPSTSSSIRTRSLFAGHASMVWTMSTIQFPAQAIPRRSEAGRISRKPPPPAR